MPAEQTETIEEAKIFHRIGIKLSACKNHEKEIIMSDLTKKAIKTSFRKLLAERPLTRITVREIAADCGINRNTFYYHYHDIPELMEEIVKDEAAALIAGYPDVSSMEECVETAFQFILENRRSINHIYHSVKREVLEQYLMRVCDYVITAWYGSVFPEGQEETEEKRGERARILRFMRYELFGACIDFMNEGMPPEAINEAKLLLGLAVEHFRSS